MNNMSPTMFKVMIILTMIFMIVLFPVVLDMFTGVDGFNALADNVTAGQPYEQYQTFAHDLIPYAIFGVIMIGLFLLLRGKGGNQ